MVDLAARTGMAQLAAAAAHFCNVASFADEAQQYRSIADQLAHRAQLVNRAKRYLAYFRAYTSTFAEVQLLRSMYQQAVNRANIVGLCVGTRPDCVPRCGAGPTQRISGAGL